MVQEYKKNENELNYKKKYLCPKLSCDHNKNYCFAHKKLYCSNYYCDDCIKEIKLLKLNRNINEIYIRI